MIAHLSKITCFCLILISTSVLSLRGECRTTNQWFEYRENRLCTKKQENTCGMAYFSDTLSCDTVQPEELAKFKDTFLGYLEIRDSNFDNITENVLNFLVHLGSIRIQNSSVSYIDRHAFKNLTRLKYLELSNNNLNLLYGEFSGLSKLEILVLERNEIEDPGRNSLVQLPKLQELYLGDNKIADMSPLVKFCSELITLDLSNNYVENLELGNCSKLEYLKIPNNKLKRISKSTFTNVSLVYLDVSNNQLDYIESDFFNNFTNLKYLNLRYNFFFKMHDIPVDFFLGTRSLKTLDLSSTHIKRFLPGVFSPISNIKALHLSWNNITHLPERLVDSLPKLIHLYLNGNNISRLDFERHFKPHHLDLRYNNWPCDVLSSILERVNKLFVVRDNVDNNASIYGIGCRETDDATDSYTLVKEW